MKQPFGTLPDGQEASLYWIEDFHTQAAFTDLGATIVRWLVPDADGRKEDIVLGYDSGMEYAQNPGLMGAIVGRNANRIRNAQFTLNRVTYSLVPTSGQNNVHSGPNRYNLRLWEVSAHTKNSIRFHLFSPDGDQGFPGNAHIQVTYVLNGQGLDINYDMCSDRDTVFNLTNHAYFNLAGHQHTERAMSHTLWLNAQTYTPVDSSGVPTGDLASLQGTCLDFSCSKALEEGLKNPLLVPQKGYDHNFVLKGNPAAILQDPGSGRRLTVVTDSPGLQLYTANYLDIQGKDHVWYPPHSGVCLETQFYPDSIHHPEWPQPVAKGNTACHAKTSYLIDFSNQI